MKYLSSLKITVSCFLLLMLTTIIGTLEQVHVGLYAAQHKVFYSWFFLYKNIVPLPGARLVLCILFGNLLAAFVARWRWRWDALGLLLIHASVLGLLLAAFGKFHWGQDTHLTLREGQAGHMTSSYFEWEVAVWKETPLGREVWAVDVADLLRAPVDIKDLGLRLHVREYVRNADVQEGALIAKAVSKTAEQNIPGILLDSVAASGTTESLLLHGAWIKPVSVQAQGEVYHAMLRTKKLMLPAEVKLLDVQRVLHAGTDKAKHYESRVRLDDGRVPHEVIISMNKPLRQGNYTFYQAGYAVDGQGREISTLAVAYNPVRLWPYVSSLGVVVGLVFYFLVMLVRRGRKAAAVGALLILSCAGSVQAEDMKQGYDELRRILVLEEGRIKPLETFADNKLVQLSGKRKLEGKPALEWLAKLMMMPEEAHSDKVFRIDNPEVVESVGIMAEAHRRYSWEQLRPHYDELIGLAQKAFRIPAEKRSLLESEYVRVAQNMVSYVELSQALAFALPSEWFANQDSFFNVLMQVAVLKQEETTFIHRPKEEWTEENKRWLDAVERLMAWVHHQSMSSFAVIPLEKDAWLSPIDVLQKQAGGTYVNRELTAWANAVKAYRANDAAVWLKQLLILQGYQAERYPHTGVFRRAALELVYNKWQFFFYAKWLYLLAFIGCLIFYLKPWLLVRSAVIGLCAVAGTAHLAGLVLRVLILQRPPVSSLYETFLFVGVIAVLMSVVIESRQKKGWGLGVLSFSGFVLLSFAQRYAQDGDTLKVLEAVLNSNFWLSTHVVTITIGYAMCCVAGLLGHVYVLQRFFWPKNSELHRESVRMIYGVVACGLVFSFLGTILGGIWADQSWGRFWGWDPKENGALLIVLWCAALLHARMGGMIREWGFAIGAVIGMIWVALAWFGINLLGVGLHSYGFTAGAARNLYLFIGFELLFVLAASLWMKKKIF